MSSKSNLRRSSESNGGVTQLEPRKKKDEAFVSLERLIVNGELRPGQWVSETDLIEVSGHTRASVRSAVQRLSNEGLLNIVPRRGAQVCPIDFTQHFRSLELRRAVEVVVARSAAKRANSAQRKRFKEIASRLKRRAEKIGQAELTDLDQEHFALMIDAAENEFAARALSSVKGLSRRFWVLYREQHGDEEKMVACHARIADAIAKGQQDKAESAVNDLIDYVEQFTLEVVGYSADAKSDD